MEYDFEHIGKQVTFDKLLKDIKGKAEYLQTRNITLREKQETLMMLEEAVLDARSILIDLVKE